eukprot:516586-Prymnesium_polylepis.1
MTIGHWCSAMLLKALTRKLKPLDMVEQIVDGEHVKNASSCSATCSRVLRPPHPIVLVPAHAARGHGGGG